MSENESNVQVSQVGFSPAVQSVNLDQRPCSTYPPFVKDTHTHHLSSLISICSSWELNRLTPKDAVVDGLL